MTYPDLETFRGLARPNAVIPVCREILADLETPVTAYLKLARGQGFSFLLESVEKADTIGQYSFLGAHPSIVFRSKGREGVIVRDGKEERFTSDNPLNELRALLKQYEPVAVPGLPAFHGGAVGYMGYDQEFRYRVEAPGLSEEGRFSDDGGGAYFGLGLGVDVTRTFNVNAMVNGYAYSSIYRDGNRYRFDDDVSTARTVTLGAELRF